jgi:hypothetical protein
MWRGKSPISKILLMIFIIFTLNISLLIQMDITLAREDVNEIVIISPQNYYNLTIFHRPGDREYDINFKGNETFNFEYYTINFTDKFVGFFGPVELDEVRPISKGETLGKIEEPTTKVDLIKTLPPNFYNFSVYNPHENAISVKIDISSTYMPNLVPFFLIIGSISWILICGYVIKK